MGKVAAAPSGLGADQLLAEQFLDAEQLLAERLLGVEQLFAEQLLAEQLLDAKQLLVERLLTEQLLLRLAETSSHVHITERVLYTEVKRKCSAAKTNLESLLLERLLLHLCELARAHRRKGSLPRLCGERVLLRVIDTLRLSGLVYPQQIKRRGSTHAVARNMPRKECRCRFYSCMFAQTTHYNQHNAYAL